MRICILGDNLSAFVLAKALVNQKLYVDILTKKKQNIINQSRTIGISKSNVDFFNKNIINIDKFLWHLKKIEIFTDNLKKEKLINFENNGTELFSIVKNKSLFEILEKDLSKNKYYKKINILNNFGFLNKYNLVVNTDFSNSITKKYFSRKILKEYNSVAYTTIVSHEKIQNDIAVQIFTKMGPLAFLPISENETSVVYSFHNKKNQNIGQLIEKYNYKYKIKKIDKINSFELKSLSLRSYYHDHILAFGDLLHRIHPLAGQGFNMTIRDIKILLEIIEGKLWASVRLKESRKSDSKLQTTTKKVLCSNP